MLDFGEIYHVIGIGGHPVYQFLNNAVRESLDKKFHDDLDQPTIHWDGEALFVCDPLGKIMAAISFKNSEWDRSIRTHWSYTSPGHRRSGCNSYLFNRLCEIAKDRGCYRIIRHVQANNKVSMMNMISQGSILSELSYVHYVREIEPALVTGKFEENSKK